MNRLVLALALFTALVSSVSWAEAPTWARGPTVKHVGPSTVVINCEGQGLTADVSYRDAVQKCSTIAANEKNSEFTTKQLVIETNESANLYSEISTNKHVTGLNGQGIGEKTDKTESGFSTWLQMKFDLSKAKIVNVAEPIETVGGDKATKSLTDISPMKPASSATEEKQLVQGDDRLWIVTTVPRCLQVMIRGERPRSIPCKSPMNLSINSVTDKELIFVAPKGYLPKILKVKNGRLPASYETNSIEVFFDAK